MNIIEPPEDIGNLIVQAEHKYEFKAGDNVRVVRIEHGTKVKIRDTAYQELLDDSIIKNKFQLNVKRINRWWYSVYFKEKKCIYCNFKNISPDMTGCRKSCCDYFGWHIENREICLKFN